MYDAELGHGRFPVHASIGPAPLTRRRSIVVISDWVDGQSPASPARRDEAAAARRWRSLDHADRPWIDPPVAPVAVAGGYLERLPLALIAAGVVEQAEIWHHWRADAEPPFRREGAALTRRAFCLDEERAPFAAAELELQVEFVGPPGVPVEEVNRLMNRARFGVVCGVDDGAPAILTEYMPAGLPVLANAALSCGLQFITPETGTAAPADRFAEAIIDRRERWAGFDPRRAALGRWAWPHSVRRLRALIARACNLKQGQAGERAVGERVHADD